LAGLVIHDRETPFTANAKTIEQFQKKFTGYGMAPPAFSGKPL
jgi:hypothetical protein